MFPAFRDPTLATLEKTATAANKTNVQSAPWIVSFDIYISMKKLARMDAWIVMLHSPPWYSLEAK
jgi:hypothetical protein